MFNSYAQQGGSSFQGGGQDYGNKKKSFHKTFKKVGKKFNKRGGNDKGSSFQKKPSWNPGQENSGAMQGGFQHGASY